MTEKGRKRNIKRKLSEINAEGAKLTAYCGRGKNIIFACGGVRKIVFKPLKICSTELSLSCDIHSIYQDMHGAAFSQTS